jgi:hypothetical protein
VLLGVAAQQEWCTSAVAACGCCKTLRSCQEPQPVGFQAPMLLCAAKEGSVQLYDYVCSITASNGTALHIEQMFQELICLLRMLMRP